MSFLDAKGRPCETERVFVLPPGSQLGPIAPAQRQAIIQGSLVAGVYEQALDRESAYEKLRGTGAGQVEATTDDAPSQGHGLIGGLSDLLFGSHGPRGGQRDGVAQMVVKSAVRTVGSAIGREIVRGVLGGLLGGSKRK